MSSGGDDSKPPADVAEIEQRALAKLTPEVWTFIQQGTGQSLTVRENREAFDRWRFLPKVLSGAPERRAEVVLLGRTVSMPVGVAPTAAHSIVHPDAEAAVARAAQEARTVMVVSIVSSTPLEDVAAAAGRDAVLWAQLDIRKDRSLTLEDALRAQRSGFAALVVSLDPPLIGRRTRNAEPQPFGEMFHTLHGTTPGHQWDPCQSWADIDWLRSAIDLPIILKGILRADDAVEALTHGASAVIVSNHGGLYMDGVSAALDALPAVAEAVAGRCEVYMDGGVRSGADVVKALSLGAKAVFIGRPILYGLGFDGQQGVAEVLECFRRELDNCLALIGCPDVRMINRSFVERRGA